MTKLWPWHWPLSTPTTKAHTGTESRAWLQDDFIVGAGWSSSPDHVSSALAATIDRVASQAARVGLEGLDVPIYEIVADAAYHGSGYALVHRVGTRPAHLEWRPAKHMPVSYTHLTLPTKA